MNYKVEYTKEAVMDLKKLDCAVAQRIIKKVQFWIMQTDPLCFSKPLKGAMAGRYRFRVGDYRIIFRVGKNGEIFIMFILAIKHRREIYRV